MVKYFYGQDTYQAEQAIRELAKQQSATIKWLDREELTARPLAEWLGQSTGLFGVTLPVLRDPAKLPAALQAAVIEATAASTSDVIAWERGVPDKRSSLWRAWRKGAEEYVYPSPPAVARWLEAEAAQRGGAINARAATLLVERAGRDGYRLISLLEKLLLAGETITADAVATEVAASPTADIFTALDAMTRGQQARVLQQVERLLQEGHSEFYVLSMLAYQVRTLAVIRAADRPGQSAAAIAKQTRLHPYVVEKSLAVARRFTVAQLTDVLTRILAADFTIKQGKADPRTGLMLLVMSLTDQFARAAAPAGR